MSLNVLLRMQRIGIFALLLLMLFLPMIHLHPEASAHQYDEGHQAVVHADFFPKAVHGPKRSEQAAADVDDSIKPSHEIHAEVDLLSPHIIQSFQFYSVLKRKSRNSALVSFEGSIFPVFQRAVASRPHAAPQQASQISFSSLRAPPYFS